MKLFSRSSAQGPGRRRGLAGRLALSVGLLLPLASFSAFAAALGGASPASASVPGSELPNGSMYTPVTPNRIADTRPNSGFQGAGDTLTSGQILTFRVAGLPGDMVPSSATAVVLNITAVTPSAAGYLTAIAAGQTFPLVSTVNFIAGQTIANEATVTLGTNGVTQGFVSILNHIGSTDVVVDVQGFYSPPGEGNGILPQSFYFPVSYPNGITGTIDNAPIRVLDTRLNSGQQGAGQTLGPNQQLTFFPGTSAFVPSLTLVPADATAVVLNVTEATATASSYLTAWDTGLGQPLASDVNFLAGNIVANRVIVPIDVIDGLHTVSVFNWAGMTDVVVDLDGYFAPTIVEPTLCTSTSTTNTTTITLTPAATGNFTLAWNGDVTAGISPTATAGDVAAALAFVGVPVISESGGPLGTTPVTIVISSGLPITVNSSVATGTLTVANSGPTLIFSPGCGPFFEGSVYYGLTAPARIADTRPGSNEPYSFSTLGSLSILDIFVPSDAFPPPPLSGGGFAPSDFTGVDVNVTIDTQNLAGAAASFLTVFPAQAGIGLAQLLAHPSSDMNWVPGEIISNGDLVASIASFPFTSLDVFNWAGNVDVIVDVYGYFAFPVI